MNSLEVTYDGTACFEHLSLRRRQCIKVLTLFGQGSTSKIARRDGSALFQCDSAFKQTTLALRNLALLPRLQTLFLDYRGWICSRTVQDCLPHAQQAVVRLRALELIVSVVDSRVNALGALPLNNYTMGLQDALDQHRAKQLRAGARGKDVVQS